MADRCRYCEAPIEWALTPKGSRIPLDVGAHADGNIVVDDGVARVLNAHDERPFLARRSHFATCPSAARARRGKRRR